MRRAVGRAGDRTSTAGTRDKLIHESFGVDMVTVWETAREGMDQTPAVDPSEPEPIPDHATRGAHEMGPNRSW